MERITLKSGAAETVKNWVNSYSDDLYTWALHKTGVKETAEDLVQETFLAALNSFEKFEGRSSASTWLFAILNNKMLEYFRNQCKSPLKNVVYSSNPSRENSLNSYFDEYGKWKQGQEPASWQATGELLDNPEFNKVLYHCMKRLPPTWNAVMQLKFLEQKAGKEICAGLGITEQNFWQIMHRSKLQLRKCIEVNWFNR